MKSLLEENIVIQQALEILERRLQKTPNRLGNVDDSLKFLELKLGEKQSEVFVALFLNSRNQLIEFVEIFKGTIDSCTVHTREIVKLSIQHNAAAVIFGHNHPSGIVEPSQSDMMITEKIIESLKLIDVRVLDHIVVAKNNSMSFARRGLI